MEADDALAGVTALVARERIRTARDGAHALTVNTPHNGAGFDGNVGSTTALTSLSLAGGVTNLTGNVTTSGAQNYGIALFLLGGSQTLTGSGGSMSVGAARVFQITVAASPSLVEAVVVTLDDRTLTIGREPPQSSRRLALAECGCPDRLGRTKQNQGLINQVRTEIP